MTFIGPSAGAMRGLADKIASKRLAQGLGIPVVPWAGAAAATEEEAVRPGRGAGLPGAGEVQRRGRGTGHPGGRHAAGMLPGAFNGARTEAWKIFGQAGCLPRATARGRAPRGHPGGERRVGRGLGPAGPRRLAAATAPEGPGGVPGPRDCPPSGSRSCAGPPPASCRPRATWARRRSSSFTTPRARTTGSSRPTPGCRWSTRSPRSPPEWTSSSCRCTWRGAAVCRSRSRPGPATRSRCGSAPRTPSPASPPRPGPVARLRLPGGPGLRVDAGVAEDDTVPGRVRLDDRQGHRPRAGPGGGPRTPGAGARSDRGGAPRGHDQQGLSRRISWTAKRCSPVASTCGSWTDSLARGRADLRRGTARWPWCGRRSRPTRQRPTRSGRASSPRPPGGGRRCAQRAVAPSSSGTRVRPTRSRCGGSVSTVTAWKKAGSASTSASSAWVCRAGPGSLDTEEWRLATDGASWRTLSLVQGRAHHVEVEGVPHRFTRDHQGLVVAPAPAIVVSVDVQPGDEVEAGEPLLVLEAMKMETSVETLLSAGGCARSTSFPTSRSLPATRWSLIDPEPLPERGDSRGRLHLDALGATRGGAPAGWRQALDELRGLLLGFDVEADGLREVLARPAEGAASEAFTRAAADLLDIFTDVCSLFRRRGEAGDLDSVMGSEEYLFTYLRRLEGRGAGLPPDIRREAAAGPGALRRGRSRSLAGAGGEPPPAVQGAPAGGAPRGPGLAAARPDPRGGPGGPRSGPRASFRCWTGSPPPPRAATRRSTTWPVRCASASWRSRSSSGSAPRPSPRPRRAWRPCGRAPTSTSAWPTSTRWCAVPSRWPGSCSERLVDAPPALHSALLEVLLRRFYRIRALEDIRTDEVDGQPRRQRGLRPRGATPPGPRDPLRGGRARLEPRPSRAGRGGGPRATSVSWGTCSSGGPTGWGEADENAAAIRAALESAPLPRPFHRMVVVVAGPGAVQHFTFRPGPEGATSRRPSIETRTR